MEFDIKCVKQKVVKGQAIIKLLAGHSTLAPKKKEALFGSYEVSRRWTLYFIGAAVGIRGGAWPNG